MSAIYEHVADQEPPQKNITSLAVSVINLRFRTYGLVIIINNKAYVLCCIYVFYFFQTQLTISQEVLPLKGCVV